MKEHHWDRAATVSQRGDKGGATRTARRIAGGQQEEEEARADYER